MVLERRPLPPGVAADRARRGSSALARRGLALALVASVVRPIAAYSTCGEVAEKPSGVYDVMGFNVICDNEVDGGGWTLIYSGKSPPMDHGGWWHDDLSTLQPQAIPGDPETATYLWWELGNALPILSDFRVSCASRPCETFKNCTYDVDLAFYDTFWYSSIASAHNDEDVCFSAGDRAQTNMRRAPARRNLLTGEFLARGTIWGSGVFEGEDSCDDKGDFTLDFNDRGMDGDPTDGTDWGMDDHLWKCGSRICQQNETCTWFVWVRGGTADNELFDRLFNGFNMFVVFLFAGCAAAGLPLAACLCSSAMFRFADRATDRRATPSYVANRDRRATPSYSKPGASSDLM